MNAKRGVNKCRASCPFPCSLFFVQLVAKTFVGGKLLHNSVPLLHQQHAQDVETNYAQRQD